MCKYKNMKIFTINPIDDNFFDKNNNPTRAINKFCMNSWKRLNIPIKVFDYNSPEIIECREKYKD